MEKKRKLKKTIINLIIFLLLIALTFILVFKDQDITQIVTIAINSKWQYMFIAVLAMCIYVAAESVNVGRILKELGEKSNFIRNIKYTLIGFFFSSITPAASGGQPMEIYYMHKDGIKVSHSTLTLLMHLFSVQIVTITMGVISAILNFDVLKSGLIYLFIIGIALNSSALALLAVGIFSKRLSRGLIKLTVKLLKKLKIKNVEEKQEKMEKELASYQESAIYIKEHKRLMIKTLLTTTVQMLAYYSVPYWIYRALGFSACNLWQILTLQATLYATVSGIPSPGAVGVSEGGFLGIFRKVYAEGVVSSAMLLSRGVNFYLLIIISSVIVIVNTLKDKRTPEIENDENGVIETVKDIINQDEINE